MSEMISVSFHEEYEKIAKCLTIDVAEPTGAALLCMMKPTGPIHGDIAFVPRQTSGSLCRCWWSEPVKLTNTGLDTHPSILLR